MTIETTGVDDVDLVARLRDGDDGAYAELWRRHHEAGRRAASAITRTFDPDDVVQEAFTRVLAAVRRGGGPDGAFRPYLYAAVRNVVVDWGRAGRGVQLVEEPADGADPDAAFDDAVLERTVTGAAFRRLRPEWQAVLWYTEVEGMPPREAAPLLGLSPNAAAALAYRARDALRTAWLQAHVNDDAAEDGCRWTVERLGAYQRRTLARREHDRVEDHLATCVTCSALVVELDGVAASLRGVLLPLVLGPGAVALAGGTGVLAGGPAVPEVAGGVVRRVQRWARRSPGTAATVAAALVVGVGAVAAGGLLAARDGVVPPAQVEARVPGPASSTAPGDGTTAGAHDGGAAAAGDGQDDAPADDRAGAPRGLRAPSGTWWTTVPAAAVPRGGAADRVPGGVLGGVPADLLGGGADGPATGESDEPGADEAPATDAPVAPGTEDPGAEDPGAEDPGAEDPGAEAPGEQPGGDPGEETPGIEDPGTEDPGAEDPGAEDPGAEAPGEQPGGDPGEETPGIEDPGTGDPGTEDPGAEDPGTEDPGAEDPGTEDPGTEDPGAEDPGTEDPGAEDPGTEDPGTEDPAVSIPVVTGIDTGDGFLLPVVTGTGVPGAEVRVLDATGAVVGSTTVGETGAWSVLAEIAAPTASLSVVQEVGGVVSDQADAGQVTLRTPTVVALVDGIPEPLVSFTGTPGEHAQALVDGTPTATVHRLGLLPLERVIRGQQPGDHTFGLRYYDPETERYGLTVTRAFVVGGLFG
ncbi:sigma-70 family RNA polymerase sigma factor [Puerhibacterium puerhi]|uniref:sigma-70 family RNA polymerase sigma factor n=1 Tax=Puerhibacterium puerhi TaxID=2692623 RepID=UPI00135A94DC|nr:sigma-70 family RNA polymerase sigma factor [Puerhibacterium puerhi]